MNKRIYFITREGYNLAGARVRCYNFSRELLKYGIKSKVLSFCDHLGAKDGKDEASMPFIEKIRHNLAAFKSLIKEQESVFYLARCNYHVIGPYAAHLIGGNKIVLDLDDWEMREDPRYILNCYPTSKAHLLTKILASKSACCIAASRYLEDFLLQHNQNVHYIPTGVDTQQFKAACPNACGDKTTFSWAGTFNRQEYVENIEMALECFSALRKKYGRIYFEVAGSGTYEAQIYRAIQSYHDSNISFKGWIAPDKMPEYLSGIDVGLFPVKKNNKFNNAKSPVKLFEYMATSRPVVASGIGEAKYIIKDGVDGFLAQTKEDFILKMQALIDNKELTAKLGLNARKRIEENYSLKVLGEKLAGILSQA